MEKEIPLSLPDLGLAQPLPPRPHFPLPLFFLCFGPAPARPVSRPRGTTSARASPHLASAADGRVPRSSATARWDHPLRLVFHLESGSDTSRTTTVRAIRARSPVFARFPSFKYRPEAPQPPSYPELQSSRQTRPKPPPRSAASPIRLRSAFEPPRATCRASFPSCEVAETFPSRSTAFYPSLTHAELVPGPPSALRRRGRSRVELSSSICFR